MMFSSTITHPMNNLVFSYLFVSTWLGRSLSMSFLACCFPFIELPFVLACESVVMLLSVTLIKYYFNG
jgi:hypothetical protein